MAEHKIASDVIDGQVKCACGSIMVVPPENRRDPGAAVTALVIHLQSLVRSEAQDTAASSGLREFIEAADHMKIVGGHPVDMGRIDRRDWYDAVVAYDKARAALAHSTPEPSPADESIREAMRRGDMPLPSINRASKRLLGDDFRTPEPSLRDALATALRATTNNQMWPTRGMHEVSEEAFADMLIAALPGLYLSAQPTGYEQGYRDGYHDGERSSDPAVPLSAQPSEPGETGGSSDTVFTFPDGTKGPGNWNSKTGQIEPTHPSKEETVVEP